MAGWAGSTSGWPSCPENRLATVQLFDCSQTTSLDLYLVTCVTVLGAFRYSRHAKSNWTVAKRSETTLPEV